MAGMVAGMVAGVAVASWFPGSGPAARYRGCPGGSPGLAAQRSRAPGRGEAPLQGQLHVKVKTLFFDGRKRRASLELERIGGKEKNKNEIFKKWGKKRAGGNVGRKGGFS